MVRRLGVPLMLIASSAIMALAWLGHLRFKSELSYLTAILFAWLMVLPEYSINIAALRWGLKVYSGAQMAAFRLCSGVVCIAAVSVYVLNEPLTWRKGLGFAVMTMAMLLVASARRDDDELEGDRVVGGSG